MSPKRHKADNYLLYIDGRTWYIPDPQTIKLLAVKQTAATGSSWPGDARHTASKSTSDNDLPISRESVDKIFLEILERDDFAPRRIYYAAVRLFGNLFHLFSRWKRSYQGKKVSL